MDRSTLAAQLEPGRSIESIARELRRDPSTIAYWVNKHGLASGFAAKHAPRGGLAREQLEPLVAAGYTAQRIAEEPGRGATKVRYWLMKHGLSTLRTVAPLADARPESIMRRCRTYGFTSTC